MSRTKGDCRACSDMLSDSCVGEPLLLVCSFPFFFDLMLRSSRRIRPGMPRHFPGTGVRNSTAFPARPGGPASPGCASNMSDSGANEGHSTRSCHSTSVRTPFLRKAVRRYGRRGPEAIRRPRRLGDTCDPTMSAMSAAQFCAGRYLCINCIPKRHPNPDPGIPGRWTRTPAPSGRAVYAEQRDACVWTLCLASVIRLSR